MLPTNLFRRLIPAVAVVALALFAASCSSSRGGYGCPNHLGGTYANSPR